MGGCARPSEMIVRDVGGDYGANQAENPDSHDIGTVVRFGDNLVPTETVHWHQSVYNKPDGNQTLEQSGRVTVGLGPIVSGVWR